MNIRNQQHGLRTRNQRDRAFDWLPSLDAFRTRGLKRAPIESVQLASGQSLAPGVDALIQTGLPERAHLDRFDREFPAQVPDGPSARNDHATSASSAFELTRWRGGRPGCVPPGLDGVSQRVLDELQRRNYSPATTRGYILAIKQFAEYFGKSPERHGGDEIRRFELHLLREKKLAPGTVEGRMSALRFLYKKVLKRRDIAYDDLIFPKIPRRLPVVLSPDEVTRMIEAAPNLLHRTILMVLYATGPQPFRPTRYLSCGKGWRTGWVSRYMHPCLPPDSDPHLPSWLGLSVQ